jgi:malonyl CoA-acyl carrier protein transacylase
MIKVNRTKDGTVETRVKGEVKDVLEQLLNATISIIMTLVERDNLDKEHINDFIDEFAQQVKNNLNNHPPNINRNYRSGR